MLIFETNYMYIYIQSNAKESSLPELSCKTKRSSGCTFLAEHTRHTRLLNFDNPKLLLSTRFTVGLELLGFDLLETDYDYVSL